MRPIRLFDESTLYFVTNRTTQARLLLRPSPLINETIGGVLVRSLHQYPVKLYAFVFTSNHFHLILSGRPTVIARFMSHLQSNIARRVGKLVDWPGKFWGRRYSAEPILDEDALVERLQYIFEHGPKEGLVKRAERWPGLTCIPELAQGKQRTFHWFDSSGYQHAKQINPKITRDAFTTELPLTVRPLPCWQGLSQSEQRELARDTLDAANERALSLRKGKPALGLKKVLEQHPHTRPAKTKRSPRPYCHASSASLRRAFIETYKAFLNAYWEASHAFRHGILTAEFPPGTFRPSLEPA